MKKTKKYDTTDISATHEINRHKVYFDSKDWTWRAINIWGFGVDSDLNLNKLIKRLK